MRVFIGVFMAAALAAQTRPVEVGGANLPAQKIGANDLRPDRKAGGIHG